MDPSNNLPTRLSNSTVLLPSIAEFPVWSCTIFLLAHVPPIQTFFLFLTYQSLSVLKPSCLLFTLSRNILTLAFLYMISVCLPGFCSNNPLQRRFPSLPHFLYQLFPITLGIKSRLLADSPRRDLTTACLTLSTHLYHSLPWCHLRP